MWLIFKVFHNGSNHDYHFIIKESAEEFKKQFTCLGENTEKYITFTVPIEKEVIRIDKNEGKITKIYLTYYSLLIAQDFCQIYIINLYYQILTTIFRKEYIEIM